MCKLLATTVMLAAFVVLDPVSAHQDAASSLLRAVDGGRILEEESSSGSTSGTITNPLYEKCHWYSYFSPWSCCANANC
ncbi:hypothetical protein PR003_g30461 [Phytophthora rubi]|uniref:RxLR effector protein n=1 Tax=Phytophthora rubi TaxID=129364 RepID=A0A6A3MDH8_9STRA|nr:hypothetical protein PR001_g26755 [Phytophthora rubi]KAE9026243.1 hypothetical protein PR002_g10964 [Phytophthora rubi]KAE9271603.1 hypothetical protein PR003_g30461 [Phytophthora rubi]